MVAEMFKQAFGLAALAIAKAEYRRVAEEQRRLNELLGFCHDLTTVG
jgi:hypothetical protein